MSIFVDETTRVIVQGITGRDGSFHTRQMMAYGTAGRCRASHRARGAGPSTVRTEPRCPYSTRWPTPWPKPVQNASVIYVPPAFAAGAIMEAADTGVAFIVCVTEGVPVLDMTRAHALARDRGCRVLGPNCPGIICPGRTTLGIIPGRIVTPGPVGLISRSGTLTYEAVHHLTRAGLGQTTCVGIGGDPLIGTSFTDCLAAFAADSDTEAVVMIGEIGGTAEQEAAEWVSANLDIPVVGFIAGRTAPPGTRMGHAGAIISGSSGTAAEKTRAFEDNGIKVAKRPVEISALVAGVLGR